MIIRTKTIATAGTAFLLSWSTLLGLAKAQLGINTTLSQQCIPLNITWTPTNDGYPYTVWLSGIRGAVETYEVDSNYHPNANPFIFQYLVPRPINGFQNYVVVVADNKGNGNSTRPMSVNTLSSTNLNNSCDPFTATTSWTWAGDPIGGSMVQCGTVRFYNIDNRGTRPFSITWLPLNGRPLTVQVPEPSTTNQSSFIYNSTIPFREGTQFQIIMGDTLGASGGASELYTVGPSNDAGCLDSNYKLPDLISRAIPSSTKIAVFKNLAGAIDSTNAHHGGGDHNVGAIAGGAIGGAVALAIVIGCLIAFLLLQKRQKSKKEEARKEEAHFVDLDGDDDHNPTMAASRRSRQRNEGGVQQSYQVSPFTYQQPTATDNPSELNFQVEMASRNSRPNSLATTIPASHNDSNGDLLAAAAAVATRIPSPSNSAARPTSSHSYSSGQGFLPSSPHFSINQPIPPIPASHMRTDSGSSAAYRLRTTNDDLGSTPNENVESSSSPSFSSTSAILPSTSQAVSSNPSKSAFANQPTSQPRRRVVMHSDGGPLPQPSSDEEDVEELPPQYGGWVDR